MEFPVFQFVPVVCCTFPGYHWEGTVSIFLLPPIRYLCTWKCVVCPPPEPSLLKAEHPQLTQPPLTWETLQSLNHLWGRLLDLPRMSMLYRECYRRHCVWGVSRLGQTVCSTGREQPIGAGGCHDTEKVVACQKIHGVFAFVAGTVLTTHQCFSYCWTVLAQHRGFLSSPIWLTR